MSKDKYMSMFLHKIEAIVFIILQIFFNASKKTVCKQLSVCHIRFLLLSVLWYDFTNKKIVLSFCNNHNMLSCLELNFKQKLILWT